MIIPKQIKIGSKTYKIEFDGVKIREDGYRGSVYIDKELIVIRDDLSQDQKEITLLHEILHIIFDGLAYEKVEFENKQDAEEWLCKTLSSQLHQIFKDNSLLR